MQQLSLKKVKLVQLFMTNNDNYKLTYLRFNGA